MTFLPKTSRGRGAKLASDAEFYKILPYLEQEVPTSKLLTVCSVVFSLLVCCSRTILEKRSWNFTVGSVKWNRKIQGVFWTVIVLCVCSVCTFVSVCSVFVIFLCVRACILFSLACMCTRVFHASLMCVWVR